MKKQYLKWISIFLFTAGMMLMACSKDKNDPTTSGIEKETEEEIEGLISIHMMNSSNGGTKIDVGSCGNISISDASNFVMHNNDNNSLGLYICDAGTKKLTEIENVPTIGWVTELAVTPGHSYVVKGELGVRPDGGANLEPAGEYVYYKMYVKDWILNTAKGIIGAEVRYYEWNLKSADDEGRDIPGATTRAIYNSNNGGTVIELDDYVSLSVTSSNEFLVTYSYVPDSYTQIWAVHTKICDMGTKKWSEISQDFWDYYDYYGEQQKSDYVTVTKGHCYVVAQEIGMDYRSHTEGRYSFYVIYAKEYIKNKFGDIIGVIVQYKDWNPGQSITGL